MIIRPRDAKFTALLAAVVEYDGATEQHPVRLGNVEFWRDGGLVHNIVSGDWDHGAIAADLTRRLTEIMA